MKIEFRNLWLKKYGYPKIFNILPWITFAVWSSKEIRIAFGFLMFQCLIGRRKKGKMKIIKLTIWERVMALLMSMVIYLPLALFFNMNFWILTLSGILTLTILYIKDLRRKK